nr:hypothetical protein [Candidatus Gracilibacteria bacterium]
MDNVVKSHPTRHFEEIRFGKEGCQGNCTRGEKNKACGRVDKPCKNLGNCTKDYLDFYKLKKSMYDVTSQIDEANEAIVNIY